MAHSTDAPRTGTQAWPFQAETSIEAGRVCVASTVKDTSTRRRLSRVSRRAQRRSAPGESYDDEVAPARGGGHLVGKGLTGNQ
ncbi:hypothetical protein SSPO_093340 [Streptomyces antimycoticus]|uniref:Uncharacterized protein n=1 Tax=Streptomyces antimycoticus TaxID=68175 RepID=A0A499VEI9_9ACTN|nr:hypothetical protein SSPO_093340 [Streptomyces antimycoticus]